MTSHWCGHDDIGVWCKGWDGIKGNWRAIIETTALTSASLFLPSTVPDCREVLSPNGISTTTVRSSANRAQDSASPCPTRPCPSHASGAVPRSPCDAEAKLGDNRRRVRTNPRTPGHGERRGAVAMAARVVRPIPPLPPDSGESTQPRSQPKITRMMPRRAPCSISTDEYSSSPTWAQWH